jgi:60 kDa SS-A/Ro ribonucleoprotein
MSKNLYTSVLSPKSSVTPQTEAIPGRESEMVENNAGGVVFKLDKWKLLDRFLILGSETPTYYTGARKATLENTQNVLQCIAEDGIRVVNTLVKISDEGRVMKNDPALLVLALTAIHGNEQARTIAWQELQKVARTGTHLFTFVEFINELGKWNAGAKRAIAAWYEDRKVDRLAVQLLKYQSRNGWSHRDVLRLAHVKPSDDVHSAMYKYTVKGGAELTAEESDRLPGLYRAMQAARTASEKELVTIINETPDFTWEMMPTEFQKSAAVWSALLPKMGITAVIRKLGQLTSVGVISPMSEGEKLVRQKLETEIKQGRVHPITLLSALKTYSSGHGSLGNLTWQPTAGIRDSLDDVFYDSFNYVEKTGKNFYLAIDCSGSMFGYQIQNLAISAAEAAAVFAMAVAKVESNYVIRGFGNQKMGDLPISPKMNLSNVMNVMRRFNWGGTDCALPMIDAKKSDLPVDTFAVFTDNETWAGHIQPVEALRDYRKKSGRGSKLVVAGTTSTGFSIADPKDPGMLDIVGFDSSAPQLIQQF